MSPLFFNSFFILVQYMILKLNVSSHPRVYEKGTIFWSSTPINFSYEPPLVVDLTYLLTYLRIMILDIIHRHVLCTTHPSLSVAARI
jgi:hypothetical protein